MTSLLAFTVLRQPKTSVTLIHCNFIVSLWIKLRFGTGDKIKRLFMFVAQKLIFFIIYYKRDNFYSVFGHFLAKHVLEIGSPWQQLRSLLTKKYTKWFEGANSKIHKVSAVLRQPFLKSSRKTAWGGQICPLPPYISGLELSTVQQHA